MNLSKSYFEFRYIFSIHNVLEQVLLVNNVKSEDIGPSVCLETGIFWLHLISSRFWAERNSYFLLTLFRPLLILLFSSVLFLFANKTLNLFYYSSSCSHSISLIILVALICIFYRTSISVFRWTHNYKQCWWCGYVMYLYNRKRIFYILDSFCSDF